MERKEEIILQAQGTDPAAASPHDDWGTDLAAASPHDDWVTSVVFSPDGTTAASASADATIRLWEVVDNRLKPKGAGILR